jgi:hypothetical protein
MIANFVLICRYKRKSKEGAKRAEISSALESTDAECQPELVDAGSKGS